VLSLQAELEDASAGNAESAQSLQKLRDQVRAAKILVVMTLSSATRYAMAPAYHSAHSAVGLSEPLLLLDDAGHPCHARRMAGGEGGGSRSGPAPKGRAGSRDAQPAGTRLFGLHSQHKGLMQ